VRAVLHRRLYAGEAVYNKTRKRNLSGEVHFTPRCEKEWVRTPVPALRIVTDDDWNAAHERLHAARLNYLRDTGGRLGGKPPSGIESRYLLVGMATCAGCGGGLQVYSRSHGKQRTHYYACPRARVDRCANTLEAPMAVADATAIGLMTDDVLAPDVIELALDKLLAKLRGEPDDDVDATRAQLTTALRRTERELKNLLGVATADDAPDTLVAAVKEREARKKRGRRPRRARHRHRGCCRRARDSVPGARTTAGLDSAVGRRMISSSHRSNGRSARQLKVFRQGERHLGVERDKNAGCDDS